MERHASSGVLGSKAFGTEGVILARNKRLILARRGPILARKGPILARKGPILARKGPILARRGPILARRGLNLARKGLILARKGLLTAVGVAALTLESTSADAAVNAGIEAGIAKRIADDPGNLSLGFGWQLHAEGTVLPPILNIGAYYAHYQLDSSSGAFNNAVFNTLGLRARAFIPLPGPMKPYGYAGAGYTWASYHATPFDAGGHFLETPIGGGIAYDCLPILQLSVDAAYRPGMAFGGDAYGPIANPAGGYTVLLGAAINL